MAINKTTQYTTDPNTVPVDTSTGSQTIVEALEQRGPVFDTVADMASSTDLTVGIKCRTLGYNTVGDGGGNDYEIVAASTGTPDGGYYIDLNGSGLQARGLFISGVKSSQWGADESFTEGDTTPSFTSDPYIVVADGQSNMRGTPAATGGTFKSNANVYMWLATSSGGAASWIQNPDFSTTTYWIPATDSSAITVGGGVNNLALACAHRIQEELNRPVYVMINARGGETIGNWVDSGASSPRYSSLQTVVTGGLAAISETEVDAFLWHQGESDSAETSASYKGDLDTLYSQLSAETWWPAGTQFILGETARTHASYQNGGVLQGTYDFAADDPTNRRVVSSFGFHVLPDNTHFTGTDLYYLGYDRYYKTLFKGVQETAETTNTTRLQAFFNYLTTQVDNDPWSVIRGEIDGDYEINRTLDLGAVGSGLGVDLIFNGKLIASDAFPLLDPLLRISQDHSFISHPTLDGGARAAGIDIDGGSIKIEHPNIWRFQDFGVLLDGSFGDSNIYHPLITQWNRGDDEFQVDQLFDGDATRWDRADCNMYGGVTKWCGIPIHATGNASTVHIYDHHPFNGRPSGDPGGKRINPKVLVLESGGNITIHDCYLDNGQIDAFGPSLRIRDCEYLINDATLDFTDDNVVRFFANGQSVPFQSKIEGLITSSSAVSGGQYSLVAFPDYGANSWSGDFSGIESVLADTANNPVSLANRNRVITGRDTGEPVVNYYTPGGGCYLGFRDVNSGGKFGWEGGGVFRLDNDLEFGTSLYLDDDSNGISVAESGLVTLRSGASSTLELVSNGVVRPFNDNTQSLGAGANRWSEVYAGTGTINTSDEREKQQIRDLSEPEKACAWEAKGLIRAFKFNDAVKEKGEDSRWHFGVIAQDVRDLFQKHGLSPEEYGILCLDKWVSQPATYDSDGKLIREAITAGDRWGVRYEELIAFIISAM